MKTSKRILAALLAALTLFSLTACVSRQAQTTTPAQTTQQEAPAQDSNSSTDVEEPDAPAQTEEPDTAERLSFTTPPAAIPQPSRAILQTRWVRTRLSLCRRHRIPRTISTGP